MLKNCQRLRTRSQDHWGEPFHAGDFNRRLQYQIRISHRLMSSNTPASLRQRILRAGTWTFVGYGVSQAIRLGGNLVMTRLLVPEMFGVMAIASIVLAMLMMLSDIGLTHNIVQSRRGEDPVFLNTAWAVQIIRGGLLWAAALLFSSGLYAGNQAGWFHPFPFLSRAVICPAESSVAVSPVGSKPH